MNPFVVKWEWPLFTRDQDLDPAKLKQARSGTAGQFSEKYPDTLLLDQLSIVHGLQPKEAVRILGETEGVSRRTLFNLKDKLQAKKLLIVKDGLWWRASTEEQK
jgi:hypothetical protein